MNIVKKFPSSSFLEVTNRNIDPTTIGAKKTPEINIGNKPASKIKVGEFLIGVGPSYSKITDILITEGAVKKVNLSSGISLKVDASSEIAIGDVFSEHSLVNSTVISIDLLPSETLYEFVVEGSGKLIVDNVELS
jgi:hypothetical protein